MRDWVSLEYVWKEELEGLGANPCFAVTVSPYLHGLLSTGPVATVSGC